MAKGYRILAKRFRTPHGEIDLIAKRRNLVAFVEVKARATLDEAAFAVTPRQQQRIIDAAQGWLIAHPEHAELELRIRRHPDCAAAPAAPSVGSLRRQPVNDHPARTPDPPMNLNVAVQMDPIARINIRGDSTFALLLEAQKRGHSLSYYTPDKLSLRGEELLAPVQELTVRDEAGDHFTLGEPKRTALASFDVVLLRQDPPFDLAYITSTHLLERIHPKTLVVNDPASVRNAPEKLFVMNFPQLMPPTLISRDLDEINAFRDEHGAVVMKPLHGHGGAAVFRVMPQDMNFGSLFDMFSVTFREPWVIQRFLPEVKHGDKRIILVDGEFAGAVNRVPAPDDLRSNMVRGGAAQATELSAREREICATLGPALRERGLLFVGIDVIDGHLTEINVTSPTGIRAIARLGGPDVAARIWDVIEKKRGIDFRWLSSGPPRGFDALSKPKIG